MNKSQPPCKPKNINARPREFLTPIEIERLKKGAEISGRHGFRDRQLINMLYRHALRTSEISDLRWDQVDFSQKILLVSRLKKGIASIHHLDDDEIEALKNLQLMYPDTGYVFSSQRKGRLTPRTVHFIIARAGQLAGLEFSVHPHMLRHSKGYQLARRGGDIAQIQTYFGHKNIQYTAKYWLPVPI